jgi:DNA-binding CsgD family transcriptional regulator
VVGDLIVAARRTSRATRSRHRLSPPHWQTSEASQDRLRQRDRVRLQGVAIEVTVLIDLAGRGGPTERRLDVGLGHDRALPFELGRALLARGIVQRRADRRRLAANSLAQAASIFERLGATPWLARARDEAARVPVRGGAGSGLTPTEAQVAGLVATGSSNREIAATLLIGVKTVESNLTRIYAKLGVRSRTELAAAVAGSIEQGRPSEPSRPSER